MQRSHGSDQPQASRSFADLNLPEALEYQLNQFNQKFEQLLAKSHSQGAITSLDITEYEGQFYLLVRMLDEYYPNKHWNIPHEVRMLITDSGSLYMTLKQDQITQAYDRYCLQSHPKGYAKSVFPQINEEMGTEFFRKTFAPAVLRLQIFHVNDIGEKIRQMENMYSQLDRLVLTTSDKRSQQPEPIAQHPVAETSPTNKNDQSNPVAPASSTKKGMLNWMKNSAKSFLSLANSSPADSQEGAKTSTVDQAGLIGDPGKGQENQAPTPKGGR